MDTIDTGNKFLVSAKGDTIAILNPPLTYISHDEALLLAAWLVAVVGDSARFAAVLRAVEST